MMFYKETNFKETPIGRIPKEWEIVKLGNKEFAEIIMGQSPPSSTYNREGKGLPFLQGKMEFGDIHPSHILYCSQPIKIAEPNDILISVRAPVGDVNVAPYRLCIGRGLAAIRFNLNKANHWFYFYYFQKIKNLLENLGKGSTFKAITKEDLENLKVPYPSFFEQQRIAEILLTVDEAIQKTNEIIAKTERLKKGLMQELLTKGIGHKEFKDTEIGRIPKEWEVVKLGDDKIAEIRGNKIISAVQKVAFIPMELIPDHGIFVKYEIRDLKDVSSSTYCEAGDLLLAKITPSLENGKQGIVPDDIPNGFALATTEVYPIVCKGIDRLFLFYVLKFPRFRKILEFSMRGTTGRQRVPKDAVEKLKIPLPPYQEQKRIAEILSTFDKKLEIERKEKARLKRIKQRLMDLLLTGKIRVKVNSNG
jgi:type I restriction enzyme S subunit